MDKPSGRLGMAGVVEMVWFGKDASAESEEWGHGMWDSLCMILLRLQPDCTPLDLQNLDEFSRDALFSPLSIATYCYYPIHHNCRGKEERIIMQLARTKAVQATDSVRRYKTDCDFYLVGRWVKIIKVSLGITAYSPVPG